MGFIRDAFESISGAVRSVFDTRSVLRPNARTARAFEGRVIGHFRRTGPNAWDKYELIPHEDDSIDIFPSTEIQVEPDRSRFRIRARGQVLMVQWVPTAEEQEQISGGVDIHMLFSETCIHGFESTGGIGAAAVIARTLRR